MVAIAGILTALGIIGLIWGGFQTFKMGKLTKAAFVKTGEAAFKGLAVAGEKGAISVEGAVKAPDFLTAPVSGVPCLYYEIEVKAKWKENGQDRSADIDKAKQAAPFSIDDGSGPVRVDASQGGDYEPMEKTFEETKSTGISSALKGSTLEFGKYKVLAQKLNAQYTVVEQVLRPQEKLFVCGKMTEAQNTIVAPKWASMVLDARSREELIASTQKSAKMSFISGGAVAGVGTVLGIISHFVG